MNANTKTKTHCQYGLLAIAFCLGLPPAFANPTGPTVVNGQASFAQQGSQLNVTNSPGAIINWQGFSINANETTRFIQQNAASSVLNRVTGQDPSVILGALQSNGRVFLINPSGIVFGQGARIDVAGLVASTLNITNQDFLANKLNFTGGALAGALKNQGAITTPSGGNVYLIASDVENSGVITAPNGDIILAAGESVQLVDTATPDIRVEITAPDNQAVNVGSLVAQSGRIGIYAGLINQKGVARADSVAVGEDGKIVFKATKDITLEAGSVTSASGPQGGSITVQSDTGTTLMSGVVEARGAEANGGTVRLLGAQVGLTGDAVVDASGQTGGGTVLAGGDYRGENPEIQNAQATWLGPDARIHADAIESGDGGKVILWAEGATRAHGNISAKGGALSGNGGFVETSGKQYLEVTQAPILSAPAGIGGTWLLDPNDVTIVPGSGTTGINSTGPDFTSTADNSQLGVDLVTTALSGGANVSINTGNTGGTNPGDITLAAPLNINNTVGTNGLAFNAYRNININQPIYDSAPGGQTLDLAFNSGTGGIYINADIDNGGGFFALSGPSVNFNGGALNINGPYNVASPTVNITGGTLNMNGVYVGGVIPGMVNISGGTVNFNNNSSSVLFLPFLNLSGIGVLGGSGGMVVDYFNWTGGTLGGSGPLTVLSSLTISGANSKLLERTLTNNSIMGSVLSGAIIDSDLGTGVFNNAGALDIQGDSTIFDVTFNNTGTVNVGAGSVLGFDGGTHNLNAGSSMAGAGTVTVIGSVATGGTLNVNGSYRVNTTNIAGGTVNFNAAASLPTLNLSSGTVGGAGNLSVTRDFNQTGGSFAASGNISLTRSTGDFIVDTLTANSLTLNAPNGAIVDGNGGAVNITAGSVVLNAAAGIGSSNALELVTANLNTSNGSGNTEIINSGALTVAGMINTGPGNIVLDNTGATATTGAVTAANGTATIITHSPLTVGNGGVYASGNILLEAGAGSGFLTLYGNVVSSNGNIILRAADSLAQNSNVNTGGTGSVDVVSLNSDITLGAGIATVTGGGAITYAAPNGAVNAQPSQFVGTQPTIIVLAAPAASTTPATSVEPDVGALVAPVNTLASTSTQFLVMQQEWAPAPDQEQQILAGADPTQVTEPPAAGESSDTAPEQTSATTATDNRNDGENKPRKLSSCN